MKRVWHGPAKLFVGLIATALCAMPQSYTISARPGVINHIEGAVSINGSPIADKGAGKTFLSANDTLTTGTGKLKCC